MALFATKALLAPGLVVLASLAARRFGARIGGLVAGLPVIAAPILLVYTLDDGKKFAASAAGATLLGMVSLLAYIVVYGHVARRRSWRWSLAAGWAAFALLTLAFSKVKVPAIAALAIIALALPAAHSMLPRIDGLVASAGAPPRSDLPSWDLPMRAGCALALVLALTAAAGELGPQLSGLLTPFPVIATVLTVFIHRHHGPDETLRLLRGFVLGYGAYALFCFVLSATLASFGIVAAFGLASGAALVCQAGVLLRSRSASPPHAVAKVGSTS